MDKYTDSVADEIEDSKFLTFKISEEEYGVGIEYITEIIEVIKITPMPDMNEYIKGVINLRGKVIPVMDIRARFSLPTREYDEKTCIIVVKIKSFEVGLIVDTVFEVTDISQDQIDPPPKSHSKIAHHYISGIGKKEGKIIILIDIMQLVFDEDLKRLDALGSVA